MSTRSTARLLATALLAAAACVVAASLAASCSAPPIITVPTPGEGGVDARGEAQASPATEPLPADEAP